MVNEYRKKKFHNLSFLWVLVMIAFIVLSCEEAGVTVIDKTRRGPDLLKGDTVAFTNPTDLPDDIVRKCHVATSFDYPVGTPGDHSMDTTGYYKARGFLGLEHLGEDWNYQTGGNTDMGHLVYAIADGVVFFSGDIGGGWGNVIRILHNCGTENSPLYIESVYAHLSNPLVKTGYKIKKGWAIGTMGNADGRYHSHLHFEIRQNPGRDISCGIHGDSTGFIDPAVFLKEHRQK